YELHPDYTTLFTEAAESSSEIIFGVRFEGPGLQEGSSFGGHWDTPLEAMNGTLDLAREFYCIDGLPTNLSPLYEESSVNTVESPDPLRYQNRDPRLKATLFTPGMQWGNNTSNYGGAAASLSTLYVMKYFNPALNWSTSWDAGQDFYVIRYAEVLLSLAEALVEKGGYNYSEVASLVNAVRERAKMPTVEAVEGNGLNQEQLRNLIRRERRVETAFEGLRLFDLYRWEELESAAERINQEAADNNFSYEYRNFRGQMEYVWPIPLAEVNANKQLEQHELWK
ncbi:MAG: RagB/SusD family nutrient uptake outer membrane protein, partial [Bacteroidia bacterium]|nr:RagB/SusD family nutrient uptake outer membrane protein [Bacteroidia bacterium]